MRRSRVASSRASGSSQFTRDEKNRGLTPLTKNQIGDIMK
jgi:hypothetical protein